MIKKASYKGFKKKNMNPNFNICSCYRGNSLYNNMSI